MPHPAGLTLPRTVDYAQRPMLVFWEVTRACLLACRHCRASAARDDIACRSRSIDPTVPWLTIVHPDGNVTEPGPWNKK